MFHLLLLTLIAFTKANYNKASNGFMESYFEDIEEINRNKIDVPVPQEPGLKSDVFSYIAAILLLEHLISTGALINERWVITTAQHLYKNRNRVADLSARFGSIDYAKSRLSVSISTAQIHPYYRFGYPGYDVAMLRLSRTIITSPNLKPLRLPTRGEDVAQFSFYVASWSMKTIYLTTELAKQSRSLKFSHLYQSGVEECYSYLSNLTHYVDSKESTRCFLSKKRRRSCAKDSGAPIVSQGVLWGVASSFVPNYCDTQVTPTLVTMATSADIQVWLETVIGKTPTWRQKVQINYFTTLDDEFDLLEQ